MLVLWRHWMQSWPSWHRGRTSQATARPTWPRLLPLCLGSAWASFRFQVPLSAIKLTCGICSPHHREKERPHRQAESCFCGHHGWDPKLPLLTHTPPFILSTKWWAELRSKRQWLQQHLIPTDTFSTLQSGFKPNKVSSFTICMCRWPYCPWHWCDHCVILWWFKGCMTSGRCNRYGSRALSQRVNTTEWIAQCHWPARLSLSAGFTWIGRFICKTKT